MTIHLPWRLVNPDTLTEIDTPDFPVDEYPSGSKKLQLMMAYAATLPSPRPVPTSISISEAKRLIELAKGKRVLEIGSSCGFSTVAMALVAEHVIAVDPHQSITDLNPGTLEGLVLAAREYNVTNRVTIIRDWSYKVLPKMTQRSYDLIFVNADHSEEEVTADARLASWLVKSGGHLVFHDYDEDCCPGVKRALDKLFTPGDMIEIIDTLWVIQKP